MLWTEGRSAIEDHDLLLDHLRLRVGHLQPPALSGVLASAKRTTTDTAGT
jgi:hypothetical protein